MPRSIETEILDAIAELRESDPAKCAIFELALTLWHLVTTQDRCPVCKMPRRDPA